MPKPQPGVIGRISGEASITVGVHLLMFSKEFSVHGEWHYDIPPGVKLPIVGSVGLGDIPLIGDTVNNFFLKDPTFQDMFSPSDWETYCRAYA